jgi:conjugative transposon TraN protein
MKEIFFLLAALFAATGSFAQLNKRDLPVVYLPPGVSVHFISPEPIRYVDISVKSISGDLPVPNVLRLHLRDSLKYAGDAVVTITGEKYIAQYRLIPCPDDRDGTVQTEIPVLPVDCRPLDNPDVGLSQPELKTASLRLLAMKPRHAVERVKAMAMEGALYHIYTLDDYIFLDIGFRNHTRLPYSVDQLRFTIEDKKVTKASTVQSVAVTPVFLLQDMGTFDKYYRNIVVLRKLTFPGNKVFAVELSEKQLSGRTLTLQVSYKDLLKADTLP